MGRKAIINRDNLLDIAEALVRREGAAALTIGGLARAAGITKGGVQYSFATKDDLLRAMVKRWTEQFDEILAGEDGDPLDFIARYIAATRQSDQLIDAKVAAAMMTYLRDPENLHATRQWYLEIFAKMEGASANAQLARVIFLAIEGLFLLRVNGLDGEVQWDGFLEDIEAIILRFRQ